MEKKMAVRAADEDKEPAQSRTAANLIEEAEREAGCRWDDPNNPAALWALIGAVARTMGVSKFGPEDDFVVGALLSQPKPDNSGIEAFAKLISMGVDPEDARALLSGKK